MSTRPRHKGFTLIEMVVMIVVLGIIAVVATKTLTQSVQTARYEHTKRELDELTHAIVGNPGVFTGGARTDFGYVGDIGALPPNLDALVQNPGLYATWEGPYMSRGIAGDDFKKDGWGSEYVFAGTLIRSTGSGADIDRVITGSTTELLANTVEGTLADADQGLPGEIFRDSVLVRLTYPDGSGGLTTAAIAPDSHGYFRFTGVPVGNHGLSIIYIPDSDTVTLAITVCPGRDVKLDVVFPADLW